jgi:hypothetical protein
MIDMGGEGRAEAGAGAGSIWQLKPWWCQPWSIVLTGMATVAASWLVLQRWWITAPAALAVIGWWWLFLVVVPAAYRRGELDG